MDPGVLALAVETATVIGSDVPDHVDAGQIDLAEVRLREKASPIVGGGVVRHEDIGEIHGAVCTGNIEASPIAITTPDSVVVLNPGDKSQVVPGRGSGTRTDIDGCASTDEKRPSPTVRNVVRQLDIPKIRRGIRSGIESSTDTIAASATGTIREQERLALAGLVSGNFVDTHGSVAFRIGGVDVDDPVVAETATVFRTGIVVLDVGSSLDGLNDVHRLGVVRDHETSTGVTRHVPFDLDVDEIVSAPSAFQVEGSTIVFGDVSIDPLTASIERAAELGFGEREITPGRRGPETTSVGVAVASQSVAAGLVPHEGTPVDLDGVVGSGERPATAVVAVTSVGHVVGHGDVVEDDPVAVVGDVKTTSTPVVEVTASRCGDIVRNGRSVEVEQALSHVRSGHVDTTPITLGRVVGNFASDHEDEAGIPTTARGVQSTADGSIRSRRRAVVGDIDPLEDSDTTFVLHSPTVLTVAVGECGRTAGDREISEYHVCAGVNVDNPVMAVSVEDGVGRAVAPKDDDSVRLGDVVVVARIEILSQASVGTTSVGSGDRTIQVLVVVEIPISRTRDDLQYEVAGAVAATAITEDIDNYRLGSGGGSRDRLPDNEIHAAGLGIVIQFAIGEARRKLNRIRVRDRGIERDLEVPRSACVRHVDGLAERDVVEGTVRDRSAGSGTIVGQRLPVGEIPGSRVRNHLQGEGSIRTVVDDPGDPCLRSGRRPRQDLTDREISRFPVIIELHAVVLVPEGVHGDLPGSESSRNHIGIDHADLLDIGNDRLARCRIGDRQDDVDELDRIIRRRKIIETRIRGALPRNRDRGAAAGRGRFPGIDQGSCARASGSGGQIDRNGAGARTHDRVFGHFDGIDRQGFGYRIGFIGTKIRSARFAGHGGITHCDVVDLGLFPRIAQTRAEYQSSDRIQDRRHRIASGFSGSARRGQSGSRGIEDEFERDG